MPTTTIPLGPWRPDTGEFTNDGLFETDGAVFVHGKWLPAPAFHFESLDPSDATVTLAQGAGVHVHHTNADATGSYVKIFAAYYTDDGAGAYDIQLLRGDAYNTIDMEDARTSYKTSATTTPRPVHFASFGDAIVAVQGQSASQYASSPTTNFAALNVTTAPASYDPQACFVTTLKNHLLIGNISFTTAPNVAITTSALNGTVYPQMVMWSATDDPTRWGDPAATPQAQLLGSDYQNIVDEYGPITGLVGGDYALVFKTRAIHRIDGPPFVVRPVCVGSGTMWPRSIVKYFDDVYFWGVTGPEVLRAGSDRPESLGLGKVSRALSDYSNSRFYNWWFGSKAMGGGAAAYAPGANLATEDYWRISAFVDFDNGLICWSYDDTDISSNNWNRQGVVLCYDPATQEFSAFRMWRKILMATSFPAAKGRTAVESQVVDAANRTAVTVRPRVLANTIVIGSNTSGTAYHETSGSAKIGTTYGIQTADTTADTNRDETWKMKFTTKYQPIVGGDGKPASAARIRRVRIPFSIVGFSGGTETDFLSKVNISVTSRVKSTMSDSPEERTGTWTGGDTFQYGGAWVDIDGVFGIYHQLYIVIHANTTSPYVRVINNISDFSYVEVEYDAAGTYGSEYLTS